MATEDSEPLLCHTAEVTAEVIAGVDAALAAPPPAASDAESPFEKQPQRRHRLDRRRWEYI